MANIIDDISRTFHEFLLLPGITKKEHVAGAVQLKTPIQKYSKASGKAISLNIPIVASAMQAVSGPDLAIALARKGGSAFIFCSQSIESQAEAVLKVKEHKAGFVRSDSNLSPQSTLKDAIELKAPHRAFNHCSNRRWFGCIEIGWITYQQGFLGIQR